MNAFTDLASYLRGDGGRRVQLIARRRHQRAPRRRGIVFEPLESRLLLSGDPLAIAAMPASVEATGPSTIVWTNRGTAGDNFDSVFGAGAPADVARAVVDAAIDSWNRVITNFNYSDGSNRFDLTLSMAGSGTGTGASAGFPSNIIGGKPQAGTITIGRGNDTDGDGNGDGAGFFIDPTPTESSEFMGNIVNAFAGDAQGGSPAAGLSDLYTVTLLELTHEMGITSAGGLRYQTGGFLTGPGPSDPAGNGSGFFWVFTGPDITALMTSFDSGGGGTNFGPGVHSAEGGAGETFNGLFGSEDSGNAFFEFGRRYLVSNKDALILKDAYDYDIVMPETFGTFYSVLNQSTGQVLIRGGAGTSADNSSVTRDGSDIVVSVDLGTDVVGLGPTDAFVTRYSTGEAVSINVQAGDGNDNITIGAGLGISITIDAGLGNDNVNVSSNAGFPVTINGNDGNDTLIANSDVTISGGAGDDLIVGSDGNDTLNGNGGNDIIYGLGGNDIITGDAGNDTIYAGTGNNTVSDGSGNDFVDLSENSVAITYTTGGGNDTVIGTAFDDTITGSSGTDRLEGRGGNDSLIGAGGADALIGGDGSDTFTWNPGDGSDVIEGGDGNDVMVFNGSGADEIFTLSAVGTRLQLFRDVGGITMDVAGVEQVNLNALGGADSATVNDLTATDVQVINIDLGAGAADGVTVNGRAVADNLTAAVSTGFVTVTGLDYDVNVSNATTADTLTVNGNEGNDSITVVVETPGAETVVYTPTATDGGILDLSSGLDLVTLTGIEHLVWDGQGDNDSLTVMGTVGPDTIVHTPGTGAQDGTIQVNSLLALSYQNLGAGASLTVNGDMGLDELVVYGTGVNDSFSVNASGNIVLNGRLPIMTTSIETLTLEGLAGDDTFTLPAAPGSYSVVNLRGGAQASAAGDVASLLGTAGADTFIVNGAGVTQGAVTVNLAGIERALLDALGGSDQLIYNGISGVAEAITVSSSGVVGGGQLSVPGVMQLTFTNLESIDVNGNPGVGGDEDTLTFAGTNAADTFQINLAADGTDADPILKLQNAAATTLLTLRNYTNFATLRVNGLEGADTFNVFTDATGPSRNLFVDGGLPTGKKKSTDQLNIFYTPPRPRIIKSTATQDPDAGLADLDYGTAGYAIQWDDIEDVTIQRL